MIKFDISLGSARISAEGSKEDIESLVATYWPGLLAMSNSDEEAAENLGKSIRKKKSAASTNKANTAGASTKPNETVSVNAEALANNLKQRQDIAKLQKHILDVPGKWLEKSKLVALLASQPVTSGDVQRVYDQLKVKTDLPTISKALSGASTEFITFGTKPKKYEMTSLVQRKFEDWLEGLTDD